MAEITKIDSIGTSALENITGVTKYNDSSVYVSGKGARNTIASYKMETSGKLYDGPNYISSMLGKDIRSLSTYKNFLVATLVDEFQVYLVDPIKNQTTNLKVWNPDTKTHEDIFGYIVDQILSVTKKCTSVCFTLMEVLIVEHNVYFFVQSKCRHSKGHILYVLEGSIVNTDLSGLSLSTKFTLQTFFNLYKNGRTAKLSRDESKKVMFGGVAHNGVDTFTILLIYGECGSCGYLTKFNKYGQFDGMDTRLNIFLRSDNSGIFHLTNNPRGITFLENNNYLVVTNNKENGLTKYFVVKIK